MTEVEGDVVIPRELQLPLNTAQTLSGAGQVIFSGAKIWFHTGSAFELVTSG